MAYWASDLFTGTTVAAALTTLSPYARRVITPPVRPNLGHMRGTIGFASGTDPAQNDVIEMAWLPAGCVPVDFLLYCDDFSSGTDITVKAGVMTGAVGDVTRALSTVGEELLPSGAQFMRAQIAARNGVAVTNYITLASIKVFQSLTASTSERSIGIGIVGANASVTSGSIRTIILDLWYRQESHGL
jgi:hypothetical protein